MIGEVLDGIDGPGRYEDIVVRGVPLTVYRYEALSEAIRQAGDFYEADILDELREMYPTQRTIVDVGANIGNHSAYWSAFVPNTAIHAFEPVPDNYELLLLNAPDAVCHPCALSWGRHRVAMKIDRVNMGRSSFSTLGDFWTTARALDSFHLEDVTLIKIDVEGVEAAVIGGAKETISQWHPALVVEDWNDSVGLYLADNDITGYRRTREWPGSNALWEWS
jgi:FkbM family methyltransferase